MVDPAVMVEVLVANDDGVDTEGGCQSGGFLLIGGEGCALPEDHQGLIVLPLQGFQMVWEAGIGGENDAAALLAAEKLSPGQHIGEGFAAQWGRIQGPTTQVQYQGPHVHLIIEFHVEVPPVLGAQRDSAGGVAKYDEVSLISHKLGGGVGATAGVGSASWGRCRGYCEGAKGFLGSGQHAFDSGIKSSGGHPGSLQGKNSLRLHLLFMNMDCLSAPTNKQCVWHVGLHKYFSFGVNVDSSFVLQS